MRPKAEALGYLEATVTAAAGLSAGSAEGAGFGCDDGVRVVSERAVARGAMPTHRMEPR
jgi:hypothetical protein